MFKLASAFAVLAAPAFAAGLEIDVAGQANGTVVIDLFEDVAPLHVAQISQIASEGLYDGVVFHRVIDGFMAQTSSAWHARKARIRPTANSSSCFKRAHS